MPQHMFKTPVPVVVRIMWEHENRPGSPVSGPLPSGVAAVGSPGLVSRATVNLSS
jgi:hypothetical protein